MIDSGVAEVLTCPFADEIKRDLIDWANGQQCSVVAGGAHKTKNYTRPETLGLKKLFSWIQSNLAEISVKLSQDTGSLYNLPDKNNVRNFRIDSYWLLNYPLNSWVEAHNHFPHAISFGYYINIPDKSAPLILDNHRIYVKEGQLITFMSHKMHWVPPATVDGRTLIAGDVAYLSRFLNEGYSLN